MHCNTKQLKIGNLETRVEKLEAERNEKGLKVLTSDCMRKSRLGA